MNEKTSQYLLNLLATTPRWSRQETDDVPAGERTAVAVWYWSDLSGGGRYFPEGIDPNILQNPESKAVEVKRDMNYPFYSY